MGGGQEWAGKYWQSTEGGAPQGLGMPETRAAPGLSWQATISHLPWGGSKPRWLVVTPTQIQSSQGILMSAGSTLWERRDRGIPWPATPRGMYGIEEVELPKGKLVFCSPKKEKECWAYAHSRCSLHMGCQLREEGDERGGV